MKAEISWLAQMHDRLISFREELVFPVPHSEIELIITLKLGINERAPTVYKTDHIGTEYESTRMVSMDDLTGYESQRAILLSVYAALPDVCEKFREICTAKATGLEELRTLVVTNMNPRR